MGPEHRGHLRLHGKAKNSEPISNATNDIAQRMQERMQKMEEQMEEKKRTMRQEVVADVTLLFSDFCNHPTSLLQICVTSKTTLILQKLSMEPASDQICPQSLD